MKKHIIIIIIIVVILSVFILYERNISKNISEYIPECKNSSKTTLIFIKGFEMKKNGGCMLCAMKHENYSQWKRLSNIYKNRIKIIGYYSKEWKDIIATYKIKFKLMDKKMESVFKKYSSLTIVCSKGKIIYEKRGEISIEDYRKISKILNK